MTDEMFSFLYYLDSRKITLYLDKNLRLIADDVMHDMFSLLGYLDSWKITLPG